MAKGYNVNAISDYVKQNEDILVKSIVFADKAGDTISNLTPQLGIKGTEMLNYLDVDPVLQDASECGFNASGNTVFTEKEISVAPIKAQDEFCDRVLVGKYHEYLVKTAANKDASDMPFEAVIMDEVVKKINAKLEKLVWQGNGSSDPIDGFLYLAANDNDTINVTFASGATAYENVKAMIMAIPEAILEDAIVFVSPATFRALTLELVEKNLFHFAPGAEIEDRDIIFPGTNVRVHKTMGMAGMPAEAMYASSYKNMAYGTDLLSDSETVKVWYDDNTELFKYSIKWNSGVQTFFSDLVVLGQ